DVPVSSRAPRLRSTRAARWRSDSRCCWFAHAGAVTCATAPEAATLKQALPGQPERRLFDKSALGTASKTGQFHAEDPDMNAAHRPPARASGFPALALFSVCLATLGLACIPNGDSGLDGEGGAGGAGGSQLTGSGGSGSGGRTN